MAAIAHLFFLMQKVLTMPESSFCYCLPLPVLSRLIPGGDLYWWEFDMFAECVISLRLLDAARSLLIEVVSDSETHILCMHIKLNRFCRITGTCIKSVSRTLVWRPWLYFGMDWWIIYAPVSRSMKLNVTLRPGDRNDMVIVQVEAG
jgi:hypothetical protein